MGKCFINIFTTWHLFSKGQNLWFGDIHPEPMQNDANRRGTGVKLTDRRRDEKGIRIKSHQSLLIREIGPEAGDDPEPRVRGDPLWNHRPREDPKRTWLFSLHFNPFSLQKADAFHNLLRSLLSLKIVMMRSCYMEVRNTGRKKIYWRSWERNSSWVKTLFCGEETTLWFPFLFHKSKISIGQEVLQLPKCLTLEREQIAVKVAYFTLVVHAPFPPANSRTPPLEAAQHGVRPRPSRPDVGWVGLAIWGWPVKPVLLKRQSS